MQKNTFSKRKTKFAGLCGAILATATVAVSLGTAVQADEVTPAADTAAPKSAVVEPVKSETTTPIKTETVDTTASADNSSIVPAGQDTTATSVAPSSQNAASTPAVQAQTPATASDTQATPASATPANQPASVASTANNTAVTTQPANTTEYGQVDFTQTLANVKKTAPVTDVQYNGTADEYIEVDNPNQAYTPNAEAITQYLNEYLTELRQINGIDIPVPPANELMKNFAQARANEEAQEADTIDHQTKLAFPDGVNTYSEDGHQDSLSSITPTNAAGQSLGSDKATAYYLALNWFADYFNIVSGSGKESFGHAISVLSNGGDGMALGLANGTGKEQGGFYAMLEFGGSGNNIVNDGDFTVTTDASGNYVLNYKGKQVKFLPKTTFHYVSKDPQATPDTKQDNQGNDPADSTPAQDPAAGNGDNQTTTPSAPANNLTPKTALTTTDKQGMESASAKSQDQALPSTGDEAEMAAGILGATMVVAGLGLATKRKHAQD